MSETIGAVCDRMMADLATWHRVKVWDEDLCKDIEYRAKWINPPDAKPGDSVMIRNSAGVMIGTMVEPR
jgi:hypothetical protein